MFSSSGPDLGARKTFFFFLSGGLIYFLLLRFEKPEAGSEARVPVSATRVFLRSEMTRTEVLTVYRGARELGLS